MKKMNIAIPRVLIVGLLLVGCAGATFTISSAGNKSTIEINNAEDSSTAESGSFSVGKGKMAYVESSLEKTPDPANKEVYERSYEVFKKLYKCNAEGFRALNRDR